MNDCFIGMRTTLSVTSRELTAVMPQNFHVGPFEHKSRR